jgi:hypothetical protein
VRNKANFQVLDSQTWLSRRRKRLAASLRTTLLRQTNPIRRKRWKGQVLGGARVMDNRPCVEPQETKPIFGRAARAGSFRLAAPQTGPVVQTKPILMRAAPGKSRQGHQQGRLHQQSQFQRPGRGTGWPSVLAYRTAELTDAGLGLGACASRGPNKAYPGSSLRPPGLGMARRGGGIVGCRDRRSPDRLISEGQSG